MGNAEGQTDILDDEMSFQTLKTASDKQKKSQQAVKIKYAIRPKAPGIMYLAGIYRYEKDSPLPALSILTRTAAEDIAFIHDRMPVIFSEAHKALWLDRSCDPQTALLSCETDMTHRAA